MSEFIPQGNLLIGDCRDSLRTLPDQSVHCVVTSPPYFGLRDYGVDGQIGQEITPDDFVAAMVEVFREVHRVLRDGGTFWLNLGDSYARNPAKGKTGTPNGRNVAKHGYSGGAGIPMGLKEKDLIGIPWRVAFALQADGWYLRQEIIWHKPNVMPEPAKDRCVKAHETIFLFAKSPRYHFDHEAIREPEVCGRMRGPALHPDAKSTNGNGGLSRRQSNGKRNRRSVWTVSTKPFKEAHFATYPPDLIEPCILAGCPEGGTVLDPFFGAGTTGLVAQQHGRNWIGCELNPEYADIARRRLGVEAETVSQQTPENQQLFPDRISPAPIRLEGADALLWFALAV